MNKKEEIEKMAEDLDKAKELALAYVGSLNNGFGGWYAKCLVEKGYGDMRAAVREFAGVLRDKISREHSLGTKGYIVGFKEMKERALADVDALVKEVCGDEPNDDRLC